MTTKNSAGALIIPVSTPTATWYTDTARTAGAVALAVTGSGSSYTATYTAAQAPAVASTRYLKFLIETSTGIFSTDALTDIAFGLANVSVANALCTLAEVKLQLNKDSTADDDEIQSYIDSITDPVEDYCGAVLPRTVTETHRPNGAVLVLREERLSAIASVTEYVGITPYVLTAATNPSQASVYCYFSDPSSPTVIERWGASGYRQAFMGPVQVTYTAGFATVPTSLNLAARMIVQNIWTTQRGAQATNSVLANQDVVAVPGFAAPIPAEALLLMDRFRRVSGMG